MSVSPDRESLPAADGLSDELRTYAHQLPVVLSIPNMRLTLIDAAKYIEILEVENDRLKGESKIGNTPHFCRNDECGTISYGTGYTACPGCGGTEGRADV